jgi:hypothetical protein
MPANLVYFAVMSLRAASVSLSALISAGHFFAISSLVLASAAFYFLDFLPLFLAIAVILLSFSHLDKPFLALVT